MPRHLQMVLDDSQVMAPKGHSHAGAVIEQRRFGGASVQRIMHPPNQRIEEHGHDWPVLAIFRTGKFEERAEGEAIAFDGPSFVFQPPHAVHEDWIGDAGLETLTMTFDPAWLSDAARAALPQTTRWVVGGAPSAGARSLLQDWAAPTLSEREVSERTSKFLLSAFGAEVRPAPTPHWGAQVVAALSADAVSSTTELANRVALNPAWLARAYRAWRGEGLEETVRRKRVERAAIALRSCGDALADIAVACGFCDQSHMNRSFRAVLGRTPLEVRREAGLLNALAATG